MAPLENPIRSDQEIKKDIVDHLVWDDHVDAEDVTVTVDGGRVVLTGQVPSSPVRRAAEAGARAIRGVREVDNRLTVARTGAGRPRDADIADSACSALRWSSDVDAVNIAVRVDDGVVTLSGSVESYWQRTLAEELVGHLGGVVDVVNELAVVPTETVRDRTIADAIEHALERSADLDAEDVTVKVADGIVTLSGSVPTWAAYRSADEAAAYTIGVKGIVNNLVVMPRTHA
ncbi:MAG: BON domain-containing protein [Planctomycetes bacterium]|nr:BON domain-containing protein [Planctomycetota bacterium]